MQTVIHKKFIVDEKGRRTAVIIDAKEYEKMLKLLDEARALKIVREGNAEYRNGKLKSIKSLSDLDK